MEVPDYVYNKENITNAERLKSYLLTYNTSNQPADSILYNYIAYHFLSREYETQELFDFQEADQTLIYDTKLRYQVITTKNVAGANIINDCASILRSNIEARNGKVNKIDHILPVYQPAPVTVIWDFCHTP